MWFPRLLNWHIPRLLSLLLWIWLLTYCMEQSPSSVANRFSASQEIPHILWNPKVHYRSHKCPPPVPILSQLGVGCTKVSVQVRGLLFDRFATQYVFYGEELLAPRSTPQTGGSPLVGCPRLLFQYICAYPPYWRPFLHPQHEDAPWHGDRDPLITGIWLLGKLMSYTKIVRLTQSVAR
jgi:hypothetical protein